MIGDIILWLFVSGLFLVGILGVVVPAMPGIGLVLGGILLYAVATKFAEISIGAALVFVAVTLLAYGIDLLGTAYGARRGGGGKVTLLGSVIGLVIGGVLGGPFGILGGAFLGAFIGAMLEGKPQEKALRAAFYSVLGFLGATAVQILIALVMIAAFFWMVLG